MSSDNAQGGCMSKQTAKSNMDHLASLERSKRLSTLAFAQEAEGAETTAPGASPYDDRRMTMKRIVDVTIGIVAFIIFLPLFIIVALSIKLDSPGPILFLQPRAGFNGRQFTVYKFRSMHIGEMDLLATQQTCRGDPRVTRVGKWLRRLSIDETPQLLNVLLGEMSLVGPRPHAPQTRVEGKLLHDVIDEYGVRSKMKPGITGWAQVNGARGELVTTDDLRRRVAYDLEYMQLWSTWFDIKIMALTVIREVVSTNAF